MNCMDAMKGNVAVEHHKGGRTDPDLQKKLINLISALVLSLKNSSVMTANINIVNLMETEN